MVSAQVLHQATSSTSNYATWADQLFVELYGVDGVDVSVSRPSNNPCHADRCAPKQNADALRSCSYRILKLLTVWSEPTRTPRSPRRAYGRSVVDYWRCFRLFLNGQCVSSFLFRGVLNLNAELCLYACRQKPISFKM